MSPCRSDTRFSLATSGYAASVARTTAVATAFAAFAVYLTAPAAIYLPSRIIGNSGDTWQNVWDIVWVRGWLEGRHGLYFTHQLLAPHGANLAWMTLDLPLSIVAGWVSTLVGLVAAYNLAILTSQTLNGTLLYHLARKLNMSRRASLVSGATFMGSTHLVAEQLGHIHELQAYMMVAFASVLWSALYPEHRNALHFVCLGIIWAITFYAIEDYALYEAVIAILILRFHPALSGNRLRGAFAQAPLWALCAVTAAGLTYPLWWMLLEGQLAPSLSGVAQGNGTPYVLDLLEFVAPAPWGIFWWLGPHWNLSAGLVEAASPGILTLGAVYASVRLRAGWSTTEDAAVRMARAGTIGSGIMELGPYLHVDGFATGVPLPYLVLSRIPGWGVTLPVRLSTLTAMFGSLLVGLMLSRLVSGARWRAWSWGQKFVVAGSGCLVFAVTASALPFPLIRPPNVALADRTLPPRGEDLFIPFVVPGSDLGSGPTTYMYWDAILGGATPDGYVSRLPAVTIRRVDANVVWEYLWGWQFRANPYSILRVEVREELRRYLVGHDVTTVILLNAEVPRYRSRLRWLGAALGADYIRKSLGGATVFERVADAAPTMSQQTPLFSEGVRCGVLSGSHRAMDVMAHY